eukprot:PhM_4_TR18954/c0_g1_i1/m.8818/K10418/DYNLL; dynein light chain LC8-type
MAGTEAIIKSSAMQRDMEQDAVDCASHAFQLYKDQKDIAQFIKREFDNKYNPLWHVIVGRHFASYVAHDVKDHVYFFLGDVGILVWRSPRDGKVVDVPSRNVQN